MYAIRSYYEQLVGGVGQLMKAAGVDVFTGTASFEARDRIRFQCKGVIGRVAARQVIIATGSRSARPKALVITSYSIHYTKSYEDIRGDSVNAIDVEDWERVAVVTDAGVFTIWKGVAYATVH